MSKADRAFTTLDKFAIQCRYGFSAGNTLFALATMKGEGIASKEELAELFELLKAKTIPSDSILELWWKAKHWWQPYTIYLGLEKPERLSLANWVANLAKGRPGDTQKDLRAYFISCGVTVDFIANHFSTTSWDVFNYKVGFLLGILKSFTYDLIEGIYEAGELGMRPMAPTINELFEQVKTTRISIIKLSDEVKQEIESKMDPSRFGQHYKTSNAATEFINNLSILMHRSTVARFDIQTAYYNKLLELLTSTASLITQEGRDEFGKKFSQLLRVATDAGPALMERQDKLILEGDFFRAGFEVGNAVANVAQIAQAVLMTFWKASKLASSMVRGMSSTQRGIMLGIFMALSKEVKKGAIIEGLTHFESPGMTLVLAKEAKVVSEEIKAGKAFIQKEFVQAIIHEVATTVAAEQKIPMLTASVVPPESSSPLIYLFLLTVMGTRIRRVSAGKKYWLDQALSEMQKVYQEEFIKNINRIKNDKDPTGCVNMTTFYATLAKEVEISAAESTTIKERKAILVKWLEKETTEFQKRYDRKSGTMMLNDKRVEVTRHNVYNYFNSYVNRKLRAIAGSADSAMASLIDADVGTLTDRVLSKNGTILFKGERFPISVIMEMTIEQFFEIFAPDHELSATFNQLSAQLKRIRPDLVKKRAEILRELETPGLSVDARTNSYADLDQITEKIAMEIKDRKLMANEEDARKISRKVFGKLNFEGKVGKSRPDVMLMDLFEGNHIIDLIHSSIPGKVHASHYAGTEFYSILATVLFGPTGEINIVMDLTYTFDSNFLKMLR